jgi:hypothetical protein
MALGAVGNGLVEILDRLQSHTELGHKGLDQEGMGGDNAFIGGQRRSALDGVEALGDDISIAHVMVAEEAFQGGATGELHRFEGGPLSQKVAEDDRVLVVKPLEDVREVVFQGTGQAIGEAHFVANEAAAMLDELLKGTHFGALRGEGLKFVAMREQELELEFGVRGVVLGMAGRESFAIPREGEGLTGKSTRQSYFRSAETMGPLLSSRQMAMGCSLNRVRKVLTHASMVSGWCSRTLNSRF